MAVGGGRGVAVGGARGVAVGGARGVAVGGARVSVAVGIGDGGGGVGVAGLALRPQASSSPPTTAAPVASADFLRKFLLVIRAILRDICSPPGGNVVWTSEVSIQKLRGLKLAPIATR